MCSLKQGQKKIIKRNDKVYTKITDHIGLLPTVLISPADRDLIVEGSVARRKFIDGIISQTDALFLQHIVDYARVLSQRNALLKYFAVNRTFNAENLAVYNEQLSTLAQFIYVKRKQFMEQFVPVFAHRYALISEQKEAGSLRYKSHLDEMDLATHLETSLDKDRSLQFTSKGVHKDDVEFFISDASVKRFGSQGQQKTFLTALKLAQFDFLKQQTKMTPLLLLDDVFDKLDQHRVRQIIQMVEADDFGQIFITDTDEKRMIAALDGLQAGYEIFTL